MAKYLLSIVLFLATAGACFASDSIEGAINEQVFEFQKQSVIETYGDPPIFL